MKFYDFCIRQKGTAPRTLKLRLPLGTTLEEAMTNLYRTSEPCSSDDNDESFPLDSGLERFLNQIKCIQCNSVELLHFLLDDECTLEALESPTTPLTTKIIEVVLEEPSHASVLVSPDKEPKKQEDALKLLMTKAKPSVSFLEIEEDTDTATLSENIMCKLRTLCELEGIGYCDATSKTLLYTNLNKLRNVLCFVHQHWKSMLKKEFPSIPSGDFSSSKLLKLVGMCARRKK